MVIILQTVLLAQTRSSPPVDDDGRSYKALIDHEQGNQFYLLYRSELEGNIGKSMYDDTIEIHNRQGPNYYYKVISEGLLSLISHPHNYQEKELHAFILLTPLHGQKHPALIKKIEKAVAHVMDKTKERRYLPGTVILSLGVYDTEKELIELLQHMPLIEKGERTHAK